jgi:hypothetical protein
MPKRKIKLSNSVGNNLANSQRDVVELKSAMAHIQRVQFDPEFAELHGYLTRDLDNAIKRYQAEKNLKVDGLVFPEGETYKAINKDLHSLSDDEDDPDSEEEYSPEAAPVEPVQREVLPPDTIPGTNIPDRSQPESYYPSDLPGVDNPYEKGVPMPPAYVPSPDIDPNIESEYDPWRSGSYDRWI